MTARDQIVKSIPVKDIYVTGNRRPVDPEAVARLATSFKEMGLQYPITIRVADHIVDPVDGDLHGVFVLVAGRHRLEAAKALGWERIECVVTNWDETEARLWEISENLHRAELDHQDKADQIEEWRRLMLDKVRNDSAPSNAQPKDQGFRKAAEALGVDEKTVRNAEKIASIAPEAKEAAREAGLTNSQKALLTVARAEPSRQLAVVQEIQQARALKVEQDVQNRAAQAFAEAMAEYFPSEAWDHHRSNLQAAGKVSLILAAFNNLVGNSVMDRRYGA